MCHTLGHSNFKRSVWMILSHRKRFVVFAPWKTASQTVRLRLRKYDESPYSGTFHFNASLNRVVHQHLTCSDFASLPESSLGYFKASFVRNPYDRVYSGFTQLQRDIALHPRAEFRPPWIRELVLAQLEENARHLLRAAFDFDAWWLSIPEHLVFEAGHNTNFPLHPAYYWTHLNGAPYVDFVGHVERFEEDFAALLARLEIQDAEAGNANVSAEEPGERERDRRVPRYAAHMSGASISKVNALFRRDFELFGFERLRE
jgi:hypothetical protein